MIKNMRLIEYMAVLADVKQVLSNYEIEKKAAEMEITEIFHNQYFYKTLGGFVNAYGSKRFKQACESAKMRLEECYADYIDADYIDTDFYSIKQVLRKIDEILK